MSDSTDDSSGRDERRRSDSRNPGARRDANAKDGRTPRTHDAKGDSDRRPYAKRDSDRKPYAKRDSDRRPHAKRDSDRKPYAKRDSDRRPYAKRDSDRKPYEKREGERRPSGRRDEREEKPTHGLHGAAELQVRPRHDDPEIAEHIQPKDLDRGARGELKTLSKENADWVARHLVAASEELENDPELAHQHALSASRRAGRVGVVRETLAITAYATGDFALALRELRTYRRISGSNEQLPLMVDSERGVGRPDRALELGRSVDRPSLSAAVQAALAIAMSGARLDQGQPELALAELEVPQLDPDRAFSFSPALFTAYAEVLHELGRADDAAGWLARADRADAALHGPSEYDAFEVFEIEYDEEEGAHGDAVAGANAGVTASEPRSGPAESPADAAPIDETIPSVKSESLGNVLEDDVREVLAAADDLDDAEKGAAGGAVSTQD